MEDDRKEELTLIKQKARSMVSANLRKWMRDRGLDKNQLAVKAGLDPDTLYRILRGDRGANVDSLAVIAAGLRISVDMLLSPVE